LIKAIRLASGIKAVALRRSVLLLVVGGADLATNLTTFGRRISLADLTADVPLQLRLCNGYSSFTQHLEDRW
jgi:hypothetical protein